MKGKLDKILMAAGGLLILAALLLVMGNTREDQSAAAASEQILQRVEAQIPDTRMPMAPLSPRPDTVPTMSSPEQEPEAVSATEEPIISVAVDGNSYIGVLEIPALGLELPVMSSWSYPKLKLAPCRYGGSLADGTLVIAGHNYNSHFGQLHTLEPDDTVIFTDVDGGRYLYRISAIETLGAYDVYEMKTGDWDLTLFTCTVGGRDRVAIRCSQAY